MAKLLLEADSRQIRTATSDLRQLNQTGSQSDNIVGSLGRTFALIGGAAFIGKAIKGTADFNQAIADLSAITGATGDDLQYYRDQAAEIGRTTSLSASQAATAFKLIASAKPDLLESAESLNAVTQEAITLAEATGMDLPSAAQALGSALNQFQIDASKSNEVINILAASSQLGTAEVNAVTEAMRNAGSAANSLGVDFAETVAGIQALAASGRQGADAGTALRQVLLRLESTGDKNLMPSVVGLNGALQELKSRTLDNTQLMDLFGQEAFTAATSLLAQADTVERLNQTLRGTNTATEQAAIRMNTLTGDVKSLFSALEGLQIAILGDEVEGLNRDLVQLATDGVNALTENLETVGMAAGAVATIMGTRLVQSLVASRVAIIANTAAQAKEAQVAFFAAQGINAKAIALNRMSASTVAATVATRALSASFMLLGGTAGVVALVAYGIYRLSESYRTNNVAAEARLEKMREELKLNPQLASAQEEYNRAVEQGYKPLEEYAKGVDAAFRAQVQGMNSNQIQEQFDKSSAALERAEDRLARFTERFAPNTLRVMQAEEEVRKYTAQLEILKTIFPELMTTEEQQAESLQKVTQRLTDQIYELEEGKEAYELLMLTREASIALDSEEAQRLQDLIDKRDQLIEKKRQEREEENRASSVASRVEGGLGLGEEEQIRLRLENELAILQEYYQGKEELEAEWLARKENLTKDAEERIRQLNNETTENSIINWESFQNRAAGALAAVAVGAQDGREAIRGLALSIAQEAIGSLIKLGIQSAIANATTATTATTAIATTATAAVTSSATTAAANTGAAIGAATTAGAIASGLASAWAPAAAFASLATLGTNAPAAMAGIASTLAFTLAGQTVTSLLSGVIQTAFNTSDTIRGARAQGGQVIGGEKYMIGERGPEVWEAPATGRITPYNELMRQAGSGRGGGDVIIHNYTGAPTRVEEREVPDELSPGQVRKVREIFIGDMDERGPMFQSVTRNTTANPRTE